MFENLALTITSIQQCVDGVCHLQARAGFRDSPLQQDAAAMNVVRAYTGAVDLAQRALRELDGGATPAPALFGELVRRGVVANGPAESMCWLAAYCEAAMRCGDAFHPDVAALPHLQNLLRFSDAMIEVLRR